MKYGSVCSGVEAASVAWHPLGWEPQWFSEIEKFPSAVLGHHYPNVPNLGDMTKFKEWPNDRPIDVLVGGTPCQSFSVAGLRKGLDDPRGNLMLTYLAIAERYRPRWLVWENVPGVLSSNKGRDFGTFLGALGKLGYGFAYRVLDAQYFGVAQRRKRVFVVGYLGDWRRAAAVLFERESLSGHPAPSREAGERVAPTVTQGPPFSRTGNERVETEAIVPVGYTSSSFGNYREGVGTIRAAGGDLGGGSETLVPEVAGSLDTQCGGGKLTHQSANNGHLILEKETMGTITARMFAALGARDVEEGALHPVAFDAYNQELTGDVSKTVAARADQDTASCVAFSSNMSVPDCQTDGTTPTLKIGGHGGGNPPAVAIQNATRGASQNGLGITTDGPMYTLDVGSQHAVGTQTDGNPPAVALPLNTQIITRGGAMGRGTGFGLGSETDPAFTLQAGHSHGVAVGAANMQVRRLTPTECERLQGFPDNYTQIAWRGKISDDCPDGPRYKAMGNSMAVPVMRWIGERINAVENIKSKQEEKL